MRPFLSSLFVSRAHSSIGLLTFSVPLCLYSLSLWVPSVGTASAQGRPQIPAPAEFAATPIPGVIGAGTKVELVNGSFRRTEGPVGMPDGSLLFTDANKITRIDPRGTVSTFVDVSNDANAVSFDKKGRLIGAQRGQGNEKVGVLYPPNDRTVLADNLEGKPFNRINDLVVDSRDGVFFTDTAGIYYIPPGGKVRRVAQGIPNPNGVILSPDEKVLYANDKDGLYLLAFDVAADGTLTNRRNFARYKSLKVPGHKDPLLAEDNGADGLAVDSAGRVYVATNLGVEVFGTNGDLLGVIPAAWGGEQFALRKAQNLAFAGPDKKTLYIVGAGAVYKVQTLAQGLQTRAK